MKMYIYKIKDGVKAASWDNINDSDIEIIGIITGKDNAECEQKLKDIPFDSDVMGAGYSECEHLDRAKDITEY